MMNALKKRYFKLLRNNKERPTPFGIGLSVVEIELVFQLVLSLTSILQFRHAQIDCNKINFAFPKFAADFAISTVA
jgi:hypothetical protein